MGKVKRFWQLGRRKVERYVRLGTYVLVSAVVLLVVPALRADTRVTVTGTQAQIIPTPGLALTQVQGTSYYVMNTQPQWGLNLLITATPTSGGTSCVFNVYETGSPTVTDYSTPSNTALWFPVNMSLTNLTSGGGSQPITQAVTTTFTGTPQTFLIQTPALGGQQTAISISSCTNSASTTITINASFATNAQFGNATQPTIQGTIPGAGANFFGGQNPVAVGAYTDGSGHVSIPYANPVGDGTIGVQIQTHRQNPSSPGSPSAQLATTESTSALGVVPVTTATNKLHITGVATVQTVNTSTLYLYGLSINNATASATVTVTYNGGSCPGTNTLAVISAAAPFNWSPAAMGMGFAAGLCVTPSSTSIDMTVIWSN